MASTTLGKREDDLSHPQQRGESQSPSSTSVGSLIFDIPGFLIHRSNSFSQEGSNHADSKQVEKDGGGATPGTGTSSYLGKRRRRSDDHVLRSFEGKRSRTDPDDLGEGEEEEEEEEEQHLTELGLMWGCSACTYINAAESVACEVCGKVNRRRESWRQKNRARQAEREQHEAQERRAVLDSMKDLDDFDDNDDLSPLTTEPPAPASPVARPGEHYHDKPPATATSTMLHPTWRYPLAPSSSPIRMCSFDMLLYCLSFLEDIKLYASLRTVCKAWTMLAEHEALWKPMALRHCQKKATPASTPADGNKPNAGTATPSPNQAPKTPATWVCRACGLIQADPMGLNCEFCNTTRDIITSTPSSGGGSGSGSSQAGPSYYTKIGSLKEFAAMWSSPPLCADVKQAPPLKSEVERSKREQVDRSRCAGQSGRWFIAGASAETVWDVARETGEWYLLVKQTFLDRSLRRNWETLDRGWEWLVNAARTALRTRLLLDQEELYSRDDSTLPIIESFTKAVSKLTRRNWVLLYDCIRTEFAFQAEALRHDLRRFLRSRRIGSLSVLQGYRLFLTELLGLWDTFQAWTSEVDGHFGRLNDQVCGERYRNNTLLGSSSEGQTPFIAEGALLAFRNHLLLHHTIREPLTTAITGDFHRTSLGTFFSTGSDSSITSTTATASHDKVVWPHEVVFSNEDILTDEALASVSKSRFFHEPVAGGSNTSSSSGGGGGGGGSNGGANTQTRLRVNLADLMERVAKMVEELDVRGDDTDKSTHAAYRRLILMPLRIAQEDTEPGMMSMMRATSSEKEGRREGLQGGVEEEEEEEEC